MGKPIEDNPGEGYIWCEDAGAYLFLGDFPKEELRELCERCGKYCPESEAVYNIPLTAVS
jgi:hypothetical protein